MAKTTTTTKKPAAPAKAAKAQPAKAAKWLGETTIDAYLVQARRH